MTKYGKVSKVKRVLALPPEQHTNQQHNLLPQYQQ